MLYITNHSSSKVGFCDRDGDSKAKHHDCVNEWFCIVGNQLSVQRTDAGTALEMDQLYGIIFKINIFSFGCFPVTDYRSEAILQAKIKRQYNELNDKNMDIIAGVVAMRINQHYVVGFTVETKHY